MMSFRFSMRASARRTTFGKVVYANLARACPLIAMNAHSIMAMFRRP